MKPEWKEHLIASGAEFDTDRVAHFGNPERELRASLGGNTIADLSHFGLISVHGEDCAPFLQGQLTQDINPIVSGHPQSTALAAICTHKGRMLANFRIFKHGESVYLRLPRSMLESTLAKLKMYVLMSKVALEDASDSLVRIGISGSGAEQQLQRCLGAVPEAPDAAVTVDGVTVLSVPATTGTQRFECYGQVDALAKLWDRLNVDCAPVGADAWGLQEVLAGIPTIYPETIETFVPQMANMQLVNGVSFQKGCYTGQEIVARMQYRGELKRRMFAFRCPTAEAGAGTDIVTAEGSSAGKVVDAKPHPDGDLAGLAVLQLSKTEGALKLADADGAALRLAELPYRFETPQD